MGQARKRGTQEERIEQARSRIESLKPAKIVCNHCHADIADIHALDSRGLEGIKAVFAGMCGCGHNTIAMQGDPEAVAAAMEAYQETIGQEGILGAQPILKR